MTDDTQKAIESLIEIRKAIRKYPFLKEPNGGQLLDQANFHICNDLHVAIENINEHLKELRKTN